ncbi:enoyl-CoA hydratase/isomerase family protein [Desulfobacula toluolica]|uniref:BhsH: putative E-phenylitaconyl-CoA hydratase n=1 Tax=Desulfobacula toluolica (strain DSM 7467 / Tol2) TaxID=651182 RepID=K0ND34_DESTT|nr:enoyl-CoA hydratase-related protein [Desulfobacula toluolica]CCK78665.1 BhsH: putative E-phenylitaconyl-CoA hydratase [Desulfobacula toluolica Tol2]
MGVEFTKEDHVAYITLNRPDAMNSLDPESVTKLAEIWAAVQNDDDIRVSVLTGAGEKSFCTGTDMKKTPPPAECMASIWLREGQPIVPHMKMWKPIICAINGYAVGGGMEMALACDLRIASSNAKFGLTEVKVASLAGLNGTQCMPRAIPQAVAMKMLLTGEMIDAKEAHRVGLISDVVEPGELMDLAKKLALRIASNAPLSVKAAKQAAVMGLEMPLEHGIAFSHLLWGVLRDTEDRKEGFTAFAEKRAPEWKGR